MLRTDSGGVTAGKAGGEDTAIGRTLPGAYPAACLRGRRVSGLSLIWPFTFPLSARPAHPRWSGALHVQPGLGRRSKTQTRPVGYIGCFQRRDLVRSQHQLGGCHGIDQMLGFGGANDGRRSCLSFAIPKPGQFAPSARHEPPPLGRLRSRPAGRIRETRCTGFCRTRRLSMRALP